MLLFGYCSFVVVVVANVDAVFGGIGVDLFNVFDVNVVYVLILLK